jgi:hypothetical protein
MSYGFSAINTGNTIQIDENFINYQIYATGTIIGNVLSQGYNYYSQEMVLGPFPEFCIVYIRDHACSGYSFQTLVDTADAQTTYSFYAGAFGGMSSVSLDYVILMPSNAIYIPETGWGLLVKNANGQTTFNSSIDTFQVTSTSNTPMFGSVTLPSITKQRYFNASMCGAITEYTNESAGDDTWYVYVRYQWVLMTSNDNFLVTNYDVNTWNVSNWQITPVIRNPGSVTLNIGVY